MNSYKLYAVNYADPAYEFRRKVNTDSLKKFGKVDEVFEYGSASIPEFIEAHPDLFKYKFGAGMHSWKPYIILKALDNIKDGDWLFYCDCGAEIIDDVHKLTDHAITDGEDFMVFQLLWATTREYTKAEVIRWLYVENPDLPQVLSGFIFMKKNTKAVALIQEWLNLCIVEKYIACERFDETIPNDPIFKVHRDDQSLLDIVVRKHGIRPYRDPSDYGLRSYFWQPLGKDERRSDYPVVVLSFRRADAAEYKKTYFQRYRLWQLCLGHYGIYRRIKKLLIKAGILRREPSGLGI